MGAVVGILLVWFIIEMLVWYLIAQFMSGWLVFIWFIVAIFIGLALIKKSASTLNPMAQQVKAMQNGVIPNPANQPPESTIAKSVAMGLAGILFLLPGLLTDVGAFLLLLPAIQKTLTTKAKDYAMKNQDKMMAMMAKQMGGQGPFGGMGGMGGNPFGGMGGQSPFGQNFGKGTTIDTTAKVKSANDDK